MALCAALLGVFFNLTPPAVRARWFNLRSGSASLRISIASVSARVKFACLRTCAAGGT